MLQIRDLLLERVVELSVERPFLNNKSPIECITDGLAVEKGTPLPLLCKRHVQFPKSYRGNRVGTLDAVQQEQLRAIGIYLSQVREEQARTLEEISAKTYIPLRLLKAIEAGQEKPLPEPVFVQGFIRRYADALGLDGVDLSQRFPVHVTPLPVMTSVAANREREKNREVDVTYAKPGLEDPASERRTASSGRSWLPYAVAAGLLALGGIALSIVRGLSSRSPEVPQQPAVVLPSQPVPPSPSPVRPSPAQASSPSPARATPANSPRAASPSPSPVRSPASNAPVSVSVNLTDAAWMQVIVDGEVQVEATLPKGTRQSWSGQREIVIVSGNAGAVSVASNGEAAKTMGALGEVKEITVNSRTR